MNAQDTIKNINTINSVETLAEIATTETRATVLKAIEKRIKTLTPAASNEKLVKIKYRGVVHECTEAEYLTAKELLGENYEGKLISE